jgi:hypothetical protein
VFAPLMRGKSVWGKQERNAGQRLAFAVTSTLHVKGFVLLSFSMVECGVGP